MATPNCGDKIEPESCDHQQSSNHHNESCDTSNEVNKTKENGSQQSSSENDSERKDEPSQAEGDAEKDKELSNEIDEAIDNLESKLMADLEEDDRKEEISANNNKTKRNQRSYRNRHVNNDEEREGIASDSDSVDELDNLVEQSETSTDDEIEPREDENDEMSDFEDEQKNKPEPPLIWRALPDLFKRERGLIRNPIHFCHKTIGNVSMVKRFKKYAELKSHEGCVNTLHFNPSGNLLASGSDDLKIILWDWARQQKILQYNSGHRANVFQAKFMPFSRNSTIVSCARDGQVRVAEISSVGNNVIPRKLAWHKGSAHKLALEPASPVIFLSCGEDGQVFSIDLRQEKPNKLVLVKEKERKLALYTIFIKPTDVNEFAVGGRDHFVRIYDRRKVSENNCEVVKKFCPQHLVGEEVKANITCLVYSHNGTELLASYNDDDIYLFDTSHSDEAPHIHRYVGHRNNATVKGVNFYGPNSEYVVSGSDCGNIFLWHKETERIVQFMEGDRGGVVNCLEPHPTNAVLATSGLDHDIKIWMPLAEQPTKLERLKRTMYSNHRERDEERRREPDGIDSTMLMLLMQHLQRRARRQAREAGGEINDDSDDSSTSESDDSDTSGEFPSGGGVQCPAS
ncbi:DDB1- and CUL4-associated factor 8-like [Antedon mediterranea]|uniref:DDB1- and CUL4-associated factor 8-like n=1 Tax=Antedon mediterranea TaxID=105859 RepID=UPI003AF552F3